MTILYQQAYTSLWISTSLVRTMGPLWHSKVPDGGNPSVTQTNLFVFSSHYHGICGDPPMMDCHPTILDWILQKPIPSPPLLDQHCLCSMGGYISLLNHNPDNSSTTQFCNTPLHYYNLVLTLWWLTVNVIIVLLLRHFLYWSIVSCIAIVYITVCMLCYFCLTIIIRSSIEKHYMVAARDGDYPSRNSRSVWFQKPRRLGTMEGSIRAISAGVRLEHRERDSPSEYTTVLHGPGRR